MTFNTISSTLIATHFITVTSMNNNCHVDMFTRRWSCKLTNYVYFTSNRFIASNSIFFHYSRDRLREIIHVTLSIQCLNDMPGFCINKRINSECRSRVKLTYLNHQKRVCIDMYIFLKKDDPEMEAEYNFVCLKYRYLIK